MLRKIALYAILAALFAGEASFASGSSGFHDASLATKPGVSALPDAMPSENDAVVFGTTPAARDMPGAAPDTIRGMIAWLAANFALPVTGQHPRVEFASPMKLIAMRYKGVLPQSWREDRIEDPSVQSAHLRDVVATYNDKTQTIYLAHGWTGATPAEQSILVHELVHHLQNVGRINYECPQAREKIAYEAQGDWLKKYGLDLETEFELDMMTLLVASACIG